MPKALYIPRWRGQGGICTGFNDSRFVTPGIQGQPV